MSSRQVPPPDELTHPLHELMRASHEATIAAARRLGLGTNDLAALDLLGLEGPMGPVELGARLGMRSASATALVDRLERAGHIERHREPGDRRRVTVTPTEHAQREALAAMGPLFRALHEAGEGLDPDQRAAVSAYLRDVTAALRDYTRS